MNETYTAPELTEVGELTADTLGDVGTEWDFTMLYL
ncbi:lasso RiPP family leader peptide-containing protein [Saccharopolyspora cebuensis]|uniref:Lasso RiPP family leader peptide-containing protein n=1 Tax=Saccharopolyspora cebuensis TaxID=418759 RepID=A0ABV4CQK1_9PSEU